MSVGKLRCYGSYDISQFTVNWSKRVTCPQGKEQELDSPTEDA